MYEVLLKYALFETIVHKLLKRVFDAHYFEFKASQFATLAK